MKHTLILVGADKGGVGKTTTSRALLDFLARKNIVARAFDTENPRGTLHRFYPAITQIIDLHNVADQMKLLDTIETAPVKVTVVDLKAGNLSSALEIFRHIGVLDAAAAGDFDIGLVHVVGPSIASLDEMNEVAGYTGDMAYVVARNFINETNFFEWDDDTYQKYFAKLQDAKEIEIPKLNEMAYEQVDLAGVTFSDFITNRNARGDTDKYSFVLRGYVRKWQSDLDAEFESLQLIKNLLAAARRPQESGVVPDSRVVATRTEVQQAKARTVLSQSPQTSKTPVTKAPVPKPAVNKKPGPKAPLAKPAAAASGK
jgi:CobQ/CobB/MinD/ParA nucleotide binding domain